MKAFFLLIALSLMAAIASPTFAQDGPPPGGPGDQDGGPGMRGPGGGGFGGGGPGGMRPPPPDMQKFEMLRGYIDLVDHFAQLSRDSTTAGVAAVISANDLLRRQGPQTAIDYFNKTLPDVKDEAVQRAIRLQLIDLYKAAGQTDKAMEQLNTLMTAPGKPASP
jgi:hypothetical protein